MGYPNVLSHALDADAGAGAAHEAGGLALVSDVRRCRSSAASTASFAASLPGRGRYICGSYRCGLAL
jgi:hypothetical protein